MRALWTFVKATLAGGFFVVLPVFLAWMLLTETVEFIEGMGLTALGLLLTDQEIEALDPTVAAAITLIVLCALIGLLMRTPVGRRLGQRLEAAVLAPLPGYAVFKQLSQRLSGAEAAGFAPAVVIQADGSRTPVLAVEQHADGRVTVLVPMAPSPMLGQVLVVPGDRVVRLDIGLADFMNCFYRWGVGLEGALGAESESL
jgi:uncharacterized membrane protein